MARIKTKRCAAHLSAFTLMEALVGILIVGIVFVALYAGMIFGYSVIRVARENVSATQVLEEKFEAFRLYSWDQINSNDFVSANFIVPIFPDVTNSTLNFTGQVTVASAPVSEDYSNDMRLVSVTLTWTSGNRLISRSLSSFVARYGLQNYVY
jgi:type II secretory pathway pseudopilin PulG